MPNPREKEIRQIFVIMPFVETQTRNDSDLTYFYENHIKAPIEAQDFKFRYQVRRSNTTFDINAQIIKDLYNADIVICDLSGIKANPNVMYELGIRLALSNEPVILIREDHKENAKIFDISGFYAHLYSPNKPAELTRHIIQEIRDLEEEKKSYSSPVLEIVRKEVPLLQTSSMNRADQLLATMRQSIKMMTRLFNKTLIRHLASEHGVEFPESVVDLTSLLKYIESNLERLAKLDMAHFRVSFGTQPTLDYYLSNQYLNGLIDPKLEQVFTGFVITYHSYFVSTNYYQGEWHILNIHRFLGETNIFLRCTKLFRIMLKLDDEKEINELKEVIKGLLKSSHIYSFEDYAQTQSTGMNLDTGSQDQNQAQSASINLDTSPS